MLPFNCQLYIACARGISSLAIVYTVWLIDITCEGLALLAV